jgi:hypothetical protein
MARQKSEELRQEVHRLRAQGLSFSLVANDLGISKAYAVKLGHTPVTDRPELSVRERRFAKGLIDGKTNRQAALDAAPAGTLTPSGADSWGLRTRQKGHFIETFEQMLDRKGLTEERLAEIHSENLQAMKVVATATKDGQITDVIERPDYATRQRAVPSGWRVRGRDREESVKSNPIVLVLDSETRRKAEQLYGGPLDMIQVRPDEFEDPNEPEPAAAAVSVVEAEEYT